jgi:hypothetical protein
VKSEAGEARPSVAHCSHCGRFAFGRAWTFGYGRPTWIDWRTGKDIEGYVGTATAFLCSPCQRQLLSLELRRWLARHKPHLFSLLLVPLGYLIHGWYPGLIFNEPVLIALAIAATTTSYTSVRWWRRHRATMQRLVYYAPR